MHPNLDENDCIWICFSEGCIRIWSPYPDLDLNSVLKSIASNFCSMCMNNNYDKGNG